MILYVDTSSLIRLYVREAGSELVGTAAAGDQSLATSIVAYAELRAALARIRREGRHTSEEHEGLLDALERTWRDMIVVGVTDALMRRAGALAEQYALRGFDAVHLSSALTLRAEVAEPLTFSAFDNRLRDAAIASGLSLP